MKKIGSIILTLGVFILFLIVQCDIRDSSIKSTSWDALSLILFFIVPGLILIVADRINPIKQTLPFLSMTAIVLGLFTSFLSCIFYKFSHFVGAWPEVIGIHGVLLFAIVSWVRMKKPDYDYRRKLTEKIK